MILLNRKLRLEISYFMLFHPLNHHAMKGVTLLGDETTKEKLDYFSTMEMRTSMSEITSLRTLLVVVFLIIKVNGKLQQTNPNRISIGQTLKE